MIELRDRGDADGTISAIESSTGRLLWMTRFRRADGASVEKLAKWAAFRIASPGGVLNAFLRRRNLPPDTPLGCWVRFTADIQLLNTVGDEALADCARDWYRASPDHPVAGLLRAWTLTDSSIASLTPASRHEKLEQAFSVLHRAMVLNPELASLNIGAMRAHSLAGNRPEVEEAARRALEAGEGNRTIAGMAAYGLALWNNGEGERILRRLEQEDPQSLPLEHVGLFVAAMMRDDPVAAGRELEHFEDYQKGQPMLILLKAAQQSRSGQARQAKMTLAVVEQQPRIRLVGVSSAIDRIPCAPEVKKRLREWLAPVLQQRQ